jgi:hypothetical protein
MGCNASMVDTHGTTSGKSDKELAVKHFSSGMYVCMRMKVYVYIFKYLFMNVYICIWAYIYEWVCI